MKDQNRTGVTVFSFGNARVNYEDSSVTTAIYLSNYAKPRPKLMTKKYNRKISSLFSQKRPKMTQKEPT